MVEKVLISEQPVPAFLMSHLTRLKDRIPQQGQAPESHNLAFTWRAQSSFERLTGILVHGWLAHMGEKDSTKWSPERVAQQRTRIERQLHQLGVAAEEGAAAATEVIDTLVAMLNSERGRWLLNHSQARREWAL